MADNRNAMIAALLAQQQTQQPANNRLSAMALGPATANRNMLAQSLRARTKPPMELKPFSMQEGLDMAALATAPVPVVGDVVGVGADAYRFATDPGSRNWLNYGLAALGALPLVPAMSLGLNKLAQSQGKTLGQLPTGPGRNQAGAIVYHGSPHKFDAFDSSKIGTGEGAQAYGHGLYFAENQDVAKSYASANKGRAVAKDGWIDSLPQSKQMDVYSILQSSLPDFEKMARLESMKNRLGDDVYNAVKTKLTSNNLYKVDLPDEAIAKMLDWDKPLSQQAPEVQKAIAKSRAKLPPNAKDDLGGDWSILYGKDNTGADLLGNLAAIGGRKDYAESLLSQLGVPGVRYLDGGSRGAGEGTRNFVVFPGNESLLKILERQ